MPYKFLEDEAIADIAFEATGKTLEEVFELCAQAMFEQTADVDKIEEKVKKIIKLENKDIKQLLYDFLSEIIFIKDTESLIFKRVEVSIKQNKTHKLSALLMGEEVNIEKHEPRNDIKAVTMHMFELKKVKDKWKAHVIIDV